MSGGHFDYLQYRLHDMATSIRELMAEGADDMRPETRQRFGEAVDALLRAEVYVQRIDWFVSGDDSQDSFHSRIVKDLAALCQEGTFAVNNGNMHQTHCPRGICGGSSGGSTK